MAQADLTTIKVTKRMRDRISTDATEQRQTVQAFLEGVLDERDRQRRLDAVAEAMASADEPTLEGWRAETDLWEATDVDSGPEV